MLITHLRLGRRQDDRDGSPRWTIEIGRKKVTLRAGGA